MNLSNHAVARSQQRGVTYDVLNLVYDEADRHSRCGEGCIALEISEAKIRGSRRILGPSIEKARGVIMVMSADGQIVTVLHAHRSARQYRSR